MGDSTRRIRCTVSLLLFSTIVFIAGGSAHAQVPVTKYVVVKPIDVCNTSGPTGPTGCAPFNNVDVSPDPSKATTTTPIGFVDTTTNLNVNITRAIWRQAGIEITFLPIAEYDNTNYQSITDITACTPATCPLTCTASPCTGLTSPCFKALSSGQQPTPACTEGTPNTLPLIATGCKTTNCTDPLALPASNTINMFFVDSLTESTGGDLFGFAWLNGNGVAISKEVFFPILAGAKPRFDTLAHELGHNIILDHSDFGAGTLCKNTPSPQGCNVMDAGTIRVVPNTSGCDSTTSPFGALFDLDTGLCSNAPKVPQADQLILGTSTTNTQQAPALLSGFMNSIPNVSATAGGGDVAFTVTFPKFTEAGGRQNEYIFALILILPDRFQFASDSFKQTGGTAHVVSTEVLHGNNGMGNSNCLKPIAAPPSIECLEIDFSPNSFTANTSISFTSDIIFKSNGASATAADLACTTPTAPFGCLDLTYAFSDLLATSSAFFFDAKTGNATASSQLPDAGFPSTIVNPADFPSVANLNPPLTLGGECLANGGTSATCSCTLTGTNTTCPPVQGGNWHMSGE